MERMFDVKGFANAWNTHDTERLLRYYADDAEIVALPNPEPYRGREGLRRAIQETFAGIPDINGDVEWSVQQGDRLAVLIHVSGKQSGPLVLSPERTIPPSGRSVSFVVGDFIELDRDGKIKRDVQVADSTTLLMQVGAIGAEGATSQKGTASLARGR